MSKKLCMWAVSLAIVTVTGVSWAQTTEPRNAWLMKNYRFTGPPPPGSIHPTDPVVAELKQIQNTLVSIMRKANFAEDYETALVAASQAAANAQLIGVITERLDSTAAARTAPEQPAATGPIYSIALKDRSIQSATVYWSDGLMLHYLTQQGSHVQVRLDLVDRDLTARINRAKNLEFALPQ